MTLTYDGPFDRLSTVSDPNQNQTTFSYDTSGNALAATYADDTQETWLYDDQGNPMAWANRRGQTVSYTYDTAGHTCRRAFQASSLSSTPTMLVAIS